MRTFLTALTMLAVLTLPAQAAELLMYRSAGCPYCAAWDQAIGPIYGKSDLGHRAPLRQIDMGSRNQPAVALKSPIRFTPTFVLAHEGRELGRIEGYPGEDFFWGLLERLMIQHHF